MKYILIITFLLISFSLFSAVRIIEEKPESIIIEISSDDLTLEEDEKFTKIVSKDFSVFGESGAPELPSQSFLIAVPPQGNIRYRIVSIQERNISINKPVSPAPKYIEGKNTSQALFEINEELYLNTPKDYVDIRNKDIFRKVEVVSVNFSPTIYDYKNNILKFADRVIIQSNISGNVSHR
ncbi:MAG: C25 family peptidase propeptide domain-containing protein, partial [Candidatus Cloacimonetes bacterium]|nr:C25 family peptidase propeptide domain-containing protein [Candidatus Cloacimonadota bacterium]